MRAAVKQVDVVQRLVVVIVFGVDTEDGGLDPQVDVLGDQGDLTAGMVLLQGQRHAENIVVRGVARQRGGRTQAGGANLEIESAAARFPVGVDRAGQG